MVKVNIYQNTKDNFYNQIMNKFLDTKTGKYSKKINKKYTKNKTTKILWEVSLIQINRFIKSRLKDFDSSITLQKLILADYQYICRLEKYIIKYRNRVMLTNTQKDIFLTLYSRLNNADFIKDLNIKVCPYCNRNYILNFMKLHKQNATAQLDHFFDKKKYPYLSVSLYNLVPSCGICNQRKSTTQEKIFYPYTESFNDSMKFKVKGIKKRAELTNQDKDFLVPSKKVWVTYHLNLPKITIN